MNEINIVMYHYIRPIANSDYPRIKGLELDGFKRQLDYLQEEFSIVSVDQILDCVNNNHMLPKNACWLTFDDGYKDHYKYAFPELKKRNLQGSFFPPRDAIQNSEVLDVNLIHFILAKCKDIVSLKESLDNLCLKMSIKSSELRDFWKKYGVADSFDDEVTIYIKRMLQQALPEKIRNQIIKKLFQKYVGISEKELSGELYMSVSEVCELVKEGMYVGSHGSGHYWMNHLTKENQSIEIKNSLGFLEEVGAPTNNWVMCYPYGAYNSDTLSLISSLGAKLGITTVSNKANLDSNNHLILPRFDTNDFPQ